MYNSSASFPRLVGGFRINGHVREYMALYRTYSEDVYVPSETLKEAPEEFYCYTWGFVCCLLEVGDLYSKQMNFSSFSVSCVLP